MGGLLQTDHVVLLPLILVYILFQITVSQLDPGAVGKEKAPLALVIPGYTVELLQQGANMVLCQFRQGAAQKQQLQALIAKGQQHEFAAHGPAFAPASGSAVGRMPGGGEEKGSLLGVGGSL